MTPILIEAAVVVVGGTVLASYYILDGTSGNHPKPRRSKLMVLVLWIGIAALVTCAYLWQKRR